VPVCVSRRIRTGTSVMTDGLAIVGLRARSMRTSALPFSTLRTSPHGMHSNSACVAVSNYLVNKSHVILDKRVHLSRMPMPPRPDRVTSTASYSTALTFCPVQSIGGWSTC